MTMSNAVFRGNGRRADTVEEDPEEQRFDALVDLWVRDEIPYDVLLDNYPSYEDSMPRRVLRYLLGKIHT